MQYTKPKLLILLDIRRIKTSNKYPVKLRLTFNGKQKYYSIGIDLSKEDFLTMQNPSILKTIRDKELKRKLADNKLKCDSFYIKVNEILSILPNFSFITFERRLFQNEVLLNDVYSYFKNQIDKIRSENRVGTASNYESSLVSLKLFCPTLTFQEISVDFLKAYEKWLLDKGKSISTVGFYLRPLRAILNMAIANGVISNEMAYPFGKHKYMIPSSKNVKKALAKEEMKLIFNYEPLAGTWWDRAKDFFIFSYLSNGMNMKDILLLNWKNIDGNYIRFNRAKTLSTNRTNSSQISVFISDELRVIIKKWQNSSQESNDFLFPILSKEFTAEKQYAAIKQFTKMVNKHLRDITKVLNIEKPVTTYFARHSFATILRNSGAPTAFISESLGHTSIKTTESYLDSFETDVKKKWAEKLTSFVQPESKEEL